MRTILLFSNDLPLFTSLERESSGICKIARSESLEKAHDLIQHTGASVLVIDIDSIPTTELDYISYLKQRYPDIPAIIIANVESLDEATRGIRSGASLYLLKPITTQILHQTVEQLTKNTEIKQEYSRHEHQMLKDMMGGSPAMEKVLHLVMRVAPTSATILLGGENGTGKEFFAQVIHKLSKVSGKMVPVNCGAIPENLFESELFGHKKGAFTGADSDKAGLVEEADNGTLFLDEIGDLSLNAQVKLLRFLQEKSFHRVGDPAERMADTRVIAATNRNLKKMVQEGTFREDLYYRLHVFPITLPPLRKRKEVIPNLITVFLHRISEKYHKTFTGFTKGAEYLLAQYDYPGNIRELENIIEHAAILAEPPLISEQELPESLLGNQPMLEDRSEELIAIGHSDNHDTRSALFSSAFFHVEEMIELEQVEQSYMRKVLATCNNNHTEAAKILGISRSTLWRKLKEEQE